MSALLQFTAVLVYSFLLTSFGAHLVVFVHCLSHLTCVRSLSAFSNTTAEKSPWLNAHYDPSACVYTFTDGMATADAAGDGDYRCVEM